MADILMQGKSFACFSSFAGFDPIAMRYKKAKLGYHSESINVPMLCMRLFYSELCKATKSILDLPKLKDRKPIVLINRDDPYQHLWLVRLQDRDCFAEAVEVTLSNPDPTRFCMDDINLERINFETEHEVEHPFGIAHLFPDYPSAIKMMPRAMHHELEQPDFELVAIM